MTASPLTVLTRDCPATTVPYGEAVTLDAGGEVQAWRAKHALPNYGVFDEKRHFDPGPIPGPVPFRTRGGATVRLGLMVCEDMWGEDVAEGLEESGADGYVSKPILQPHDFLRRALGLMEEAA